MNHSTTLPSNPPRSPPRTTQMRSKDSNNNNGRVSRRDRISRSERTGTSDRRTRDTMMDSSSNSHCRPSTRRQLTSDSNHTSSTVRSSASRRAREERRRIQGSKDDGIVERRRNRSFKKRRSSSSATKELLDKLALSEHSALRDDDASESQASALTDFTKSIQSASSKHYTHRTNGGGKRRSTANLHNSFSITDNSTTIPSTSSPPNSRLSTCASRQERRRRRRGQGGRDSLNASLRRSSTHDGTTTHDGIMEEDDSIRILQFDVSRSGGLSYVDANNVHAKSSKNSYVDNMTILLKEDLVKEQPVEGDADPTEGNSSLEGSFHNMPQLEELNDEQGLLEPSTEEQENNNKKQLGQIAKSKFKAVSKLLATPKKRRKAVVKGDVAERLNMSMATLQI